MNSTTLLKLVFVAIAAAMLPPARIATAATCYVNFNSFTPAAPYTNWATAATEIQDAVDAALAGDLVLVTNGLLYGVLQAGAQHMHGMSNRVAVTKPITLQSVNGPAVTTIVGQQVPGSADGNGVRRCALRVLVERGGAFWPHPGIRGDVKLRRLRD